MRKVRKAIRKEEREKKKNEPKVKNLVSIRKVKDRKGLFSFYNPYM